MINFRFKFTTHFTRYHIKLIVYQCCTKLRNTLCFFSIRMLFFRPRLNILIFLPILGRKYSCFILRLWLMTYRKIRKISPGAYIFQRPFLRGLFLEGLIFGGAYVRREICISKSIGLACTGKEIYNFCFVLLCIPEKIPCISPPGCLY